MQAIWSATGLGAGERVGVDVAGSAVDALSDVLDPLTAGLSLRVRVSRRTRVVDAWANAVLDLPHRRFERPRCRVVRSEHEKDHVRGKRSDGARVLRPQIRQSHVVIGSLTRVADSLHAMTCLRELLLHVQARRTGSLTVTHDENLHTADGSIDPAVRKNRIEKLQPGFLLDPYNWIEGTSLEDYCSEDDAGFFHVTTNRDRVFDQGLRARSETGIVGLGGGWTDRKGNRVSFTINHNRALWLYEAMRGLRLAMRDDDAATVLRLALDWTGFPGDQWSFNFDEAEEASASWDDLGDLCTELNLTPPKEIQDLAFRGAWDHMLNEQAEALDEKWSGPEGRYRLAQFFESRLESTFYIPEWWDDGTCVPLVGFTASADVYGTIEPDQFSIVQAAVREGADEDAVHRECELRFGSKDIQVVAIDCEYAFNVIRVPPRSF